MKTAKEIWQNLHKTHESTHMDGPVANCLVDSIW